MTNVRRSRAAAAGATLGLLLVVACGACSTTVGQPADTPSTSITSPRPRDPTATLATAVDENLSDLITQIEQGRDEDDIEGYAGVAVDAEHSALDLWWVGDPPARVAQLVAEPPHDLVIRLHPAAYDYATTDRAVTRLMDRYPVIHAGSPESDGSGIEVETTAKGRREIPSSSELTRQVKLPVRVVISEPPVPA